jgi:hypothetical protein
MQLWISRPATVCSVDEKCVDGRCCDMLSKRRDVFLSRTECLTGYNGLSKTTRQCPFVEWNGSVSERSYLRCLFRTMSEILWTCTYTL